MFRAAKKVLIVEDDTDVSQTVAEAITAAGFHVRTAVDGQQALDYIRQDRPDLILLDLMLPRMNGREFIGELRAQFEDIEVPVVLVSASPNLAEEAETLQIKNYLPKPFSLRSITSLVQQYCG